MRERLHVWHDRYITPGFISPGSIILYFIVLAFATVGIAALQHQQRDFRSNALTGCKRQNTQNAALLDLGRIITKARAQTSTSPRVLDASRDYLRQVKRLDPGSPTSRALQDLAVLIGGDKGKPADVRVLARAEDDFIHKAHMIERPRDCEAAYG